MLVLDDWLGKTHKVTPTPGGAALEAPPAGEAPAEAAAAVLEAPVDETEEVAAPVEAADAPVLEAPVEEVVAAVEEEEVAAPVEAAAVEEEELKEEEEPNAAVAGGRRWLLGQCACRNGQCAAGVATVFPPAAAV